MFVDWSCGHATNPSTIARRVPRDARPAPDGRPGAAAVRRRPGHLQGRPRCARGCEVPLHQAGWILRPIDGWRRSSIRAGSRSRSSNRPAALAPAHPTARALQPPIRPNSRERRQPGTGGPCHTASHSVLSGHAADVARIDARFPAAGIFHVRLHILAGHGRASRYFGCSPWRYFTSASMRAAVFSAPTLPLDFDSTSPQAGMSVALCELLL